MILFYFKLLTLTKLKKSSSVASLLSISLEHFSQRCFIIHHLFFLLSIQIGDISQKQFDSLSQGNL